MQCMRRHRCRGINELFLPLCSLISSMSAATAAADEVDPELERQWEERTRPAREAPRVNSMYLRKDYAAACPHQHIAYLKCMKDSKSWVPGMFSSCQDEWRAFSICKQRAKAVNGPPPGQGQEPRPGTLTRMWNALQKEPMYIAASLSVQMYMEQFGLRSPPGSDSSSDTSSSSSSTGSSANTS